MKTVGFPISKKENENRRAIVPDDIIGIKHPEMLFFEKGYGKVLGFGDEDYIKQGANISSREEVLTKDVICDPKAGDADYLGCLNDQTVFGWIHAVQNAEITQKIIDNKLTAIAWENMFEGGRHVFWRNNELAGEAAVMHAFQCWGRMPYECKVAVIGRGNTARGAVKILDMLGASIVQYDRTTESLLKTELHKYDVIVNCVLWDVKRTDHIISKSDLKTMRNGSMIIDVSCDRNGGIETSIPTSIEDPTYVIDGIVHYAVDHTPALFYKTFSAENSKIVAPYINDLVCENKNEILKIATVIYNGKIIDKQIIEHQNR